MFLSVGNSFGAPKAIDKLGAFHKMLVERGFHPQAVLIGISRGGLYAHRYAATYPERVSVIYDDAAVLDYQSRPGGKGCSHHPRALLTWAISWRPVDAWSCLDAPRLEEGSLPDPSDPSDPSPSFIPKNINIR